jgi:ATP-dependent DNA helicase 2 subunit 2
VQIKSKPKPGRLVSNETPLEDFRALIEGESDVFRKAIQDLGQVVEENVAASFSRKAFPLAIDCLKAMRETALMYEEVETYNEWVVKFGAQLMSRYLNELENYVTDPGFKHKDFWDREC